MRFFLFGIEYSIIGLYKLTLSSFFIMGETKVAEMKGAEALVETLKQYKI